MAVGGLKLWAHKHLLPQWKVLVYQPDSIYALIVSSHYTLNGAIRKERDLNGQRMTCPGDLGKNIKVKVQKSTCF